MPFRLLSKPLLTVCFSRTRLAGETGQCRVLGSGPEGLTLSPPPPGSQDPPSNQRQVALTAPQCGSAEREVRVLLTLSQGLAGPINYRNPDLLSHSQGVGLPSGQGHFPCPPASALGEWGRLSHSLCPGLPTPAWHRTTQPGTASEELCTGSHLFVTELRLKSKFQKLQPPHLGRLTPSAQSMVQASEVPF